MESNNVELTTNYQSNNNKNKKIEVDKVFQQKGIMPTYVEEMYGFKDKKASEDFNKIYNFKGEK